MRYRPLGRSGDVISEIGFGTWGLGGTHGGAVAYGPTDDRESLAALRCAYRHGVTFYDTADLYGHGHGEELLGRAFETVRGDVVLTTKAGLRDASGAQDFSPAHLAEALANSLERLRTTYVDLFLLHSPPLELLEREPAIWECLEAMRRQGKTAGIGVSVRSPDEGLAVAAEFAPDAIQVNYNLADQRAAENGLFDFCHEHGIGVIVRTPLCFGFLTGDAGERFPDGDHRSRWSVAQRERWREARTVFGEDLSDGQTPAQFALRFCLSHAGVSTVIPGMLTPAHVEENVRASDLGPLDEDALQRVQRIYRSRTFFLGK